MDFTPIDGFCCPFVGKFPSTPDYEPRIAKFMAWVKSLPAKPDHFKRYPSAPNVVSLKDQPFVIKIVEEGYAFMFHGAFAPRDGEGDTGGFERISYFELITSDFKEIQFDEGETSEVVVCDTHEKRFLLGLYLRAPGVTNLWSNKLRTAASVPKPPEESCGCQENGGMPVAVTAPDATGKQDEDRTAMVSTGPNPKRHGTHKPQELASAQQSDNGTLT